MAQDYRTERREIVFVDNGTEGTSSTRSVDPSVKILDQFSEIRLISEPKRGAYIARNAGVRAARGEILAFTDADCAPDANWLTRIAESMELSETQMVLGRQRFGSASGALAILADYEAEKSRYVLTGSEPERYYAYAGNLAVRREAFDGCGGFREIQRGGDVLFAHSAIEHYGCEAIRYDPEMVITNGDIESLGDWLRKMYIYGRSAGNYGRMSKARPLKASERWEIFRACTRRSDWDLRKIAIAGVVLPLVAVVYEIGRRFPLR